MGDLRKRWLGFWEIDDEGNKAYDYYKSRPGYASFESSCPERPCLVVVRGGGGRDPCPVK